MTPSRSLWLWLSLLLGCDGGISEMTQSVKRVATTAGVDAQDLSVGCPAGTLAYDGWSGEYPGPILQVNSPITVPGLSIVCDEKPSLNCTVPAGLYHPWSEVSRAEFKTVGVVRRYMATQDARLGGQAIPKGTEVVEQFYMAEGMCGMSVNGQAIEDDCIGHNAMSSRFKELPAATPGFENQQYLGVTCAEGHKAWIRITKKIMTMPQVQEGEILQYGEVGPSLLKDGSPSPLDKWAGRRSDQTYDLGIPEGEGPFWTVAVQAGGSEGASKAKVDKLRASGFPAHTAWLGRYGSAKYKGLWLVYVGPFSYSDRDSAQAMMARVRAAGFPDAYAVTLGRRGQREQLR